MHGLHLAEARVAGQRAQHPKTQLVEQWQHLPQLTRDVVLAHQGDIMDPESIPLDARRDRVRLAGTAHMLDHGVAGNAVAEILGPVEPCPIDGHDGGAPTALRLLAHGPDVLADQCRDTGVVDEHRCRIIGVDGLFDGMEQPLLAPAHHQVLLGEIGRHADLVEGGTGGSGTPVIPGVAGAGDGAMNDMSHVGNGKKRDLGAVEGATTSGRPRLRLGTAGLCLLVVGAGRLVEQGSDVFALHGLSRASCSVSPDAGPVPRAILLIQRRKSRLRVCRVCDNTERLKDR